MFQTRNASCVLYREKLGPVSYIQECTTGLGRRSWGASGNLVSSGRILNCASLRGSPGTLSFGNSNLSNSHCKIRIEITEIWPRTTNPLLPPGEQIVPRILWKKSGSAHGNMKAELFSCCLVLFLFYSQWKGEVDVGLPGKITSCIYIQYCIVQFNLHYLITKQLINNCIKWFFLNN